MSASLVVYHTADVHGRRGFGRLLAQVVEPGALLVDCGDSLLGSSTVYRRVEPVVREFAAAPYRAQAVGNREFHYVHAWFAARARALPMPMICSNLLDLRDRAAPFKRSLVVDAGGVRVRLLALLAPQYRTGSGWEAVFGWRFLSVEAAMDEMLGTRESADVTLVLSHLGLPGDRELAHAYPDIGAIIGGHSHITLADPEIVAGVPIVHAGAHASNAGRLELDLTGTRPQVRSFVLIPLLGKAG
ncbi:MAG: metallophosphoesterase [Candidatus Eremiobacteraeota bacterium]|nr:metallophosphoesterase [Candidatus Eremiobacteraeota bacterium]MBV8281873.1 metallophosphoesterase [Candidatus Eremiobacteraeota bacterium]